MLSLSSEAQSALDAGRFVMRTGIVFYLGGGTHAFWDGVGPYTYGGVTFEASGSLLEIGDIPAVGTLASEKVEVTLRAIANTELSPDVLATIEDEQYHQRPVTIWQFIFDADTGSLATAIRHYSGYIDQIEHKDEDGEYSLVASLESRSRDHQKTGYRMRSTSDQDQISSGDLFYQHVSTTSTVTRKWGTTKSS